MLSWCVAIKIFCIVSCEAVACGLDDVSNNRLRHADVPGIRLPFSYSSKNNLNEIHISHSTQWDSLILCPIFSLDIYYYPGSRLSKACLIIFQDCAFNKQHSSSVLRVAFQENMRVWDTYAQKNHNLHRHRSSGGYCENIPQGAVGVELWVGKCSGGDTLGDASTGWNSVSRIMIEKLSRPHS